ncbi:MULTISPECIES: REP-associated tyrosine transposase [Pseudoalteromonas]|jgi:putative transposase|uniref:REP-associated tyrosine transposase n=2 Tax=Pseudoalteromonas TaxID=53246 RepID=UPI0016022C36|nr:MULTISPECIES: transposase [unclassified Pseudoalteromonas]MBB1344594.1 transposase [Pseudoalteromonas sp. SG45-2]MBB1350561.1 transposase [Pseudoalteromonas sp. SG45-3]MBB1358840.1 transposase [Pseudoalteromonas sp. SG45-6]MBB1400608.1 transposase [Pseudoalteromonas sp. SG45-1]MBB1429087.1 transposase [Pseudoalteromonas sp. SG43-4]
MQYRRNYVKGGSYFFTVNLLDRNKSLLVEHIDLLRESIRVVKFQRPFYIDAWVVLPDHLHAVLTLPDNDTDYSGRWREIKKRFSKSLPKTEFLTQTRKRKNERGIWQRRFWEHTIRDDNDYWHHVNYVHFNPLKHGLVSRIVDWPYSSFHRAVKRGIYTNNWCGEKI